LGLQTDYRGMSSGDYTVAEKSGGWSCALHDDGSYWGSMVVVARSINTTLNGALLSIQIKNTDVRLP
jgi:hypothetical protein